jgi:hypothetical protein
MDWLIRGMFGDRDRVEILPGLVMRVWHEAVTTSDGMTFVVDKLRLVCDWFPW